MNTIETTFGSLNPGEDFFSPRTGERQPIKLDVCYQLKGGTKKNAFVPGYCGAPPTLAFFEDSEVVYVRNTPQPLTREQRLKAFKRDYDAAHTLA